MRLSAPGWARFFLLPLAGEGRPAKRGHVQAASSLIRPDFVGPRSAASGRRKGSVLLALLLALAALPAPARADATLTLTGDNAILYDSQRDACAPIDVPDINPRAYRDASGQVVMFAMHFQNRALRGPDLTHLKLDCKVVLDSAFDANPAHYDDRRYVAATWTTDGTNVAALVHEEYHADNHKTCSVADSLGCWFNTVLAFHSGDGGGSFVPSNPLVVASAPFRQNVEQGRHRGFFNPSNMFSDGRYTYAFISTTGWTGQAPGNCLFRTTNPSDSGAWRAWDGNSFSVRYANPYTSHAKPLACQNIEPFLFPVAAVVHDTRHKLWIALFQSAVTGTTPLEGFYYATARDLFHWSAPRLLMAGRTAYSDLCKVGSSIVNYPSILDPTSPSRNFDTIAGRPLLFFDIIAIEGCQTGQRLLVSRPLKLDYDAQ